MTDVNDMKIILGKTIKGLVVKENTEQSMPRMALHLVFTDETSYEVYSDGNLFFTTGLAGGGMADARAYLTSTHGPITNILDVSIAD